jgi:hypothetical protein
MSIAYTNAVWASTIAPPVRWLVLALADYADKDGHCWPKIATLAARLRVTERSVYRWLGRAEDAGYVRRISGGGFRMVNHYWLNLAVINPDSTVTVSTTETLTSATRNPDASVGQNPVSGVTLNRQLEPSTATTAPKLVCPMCSAPAMVKEGRFGSFTGCSRYPACKWTEKPPQPKMTERELERARLLGQRLHEDAWLRDHPETAQ